MDKFHKTNEIILNIGTYNIAGGRQVNRDLRVIANDILEQELDIVGIQEVDLNAGRSGYIDMMKLLSEYTGYDYAFFKALDMSCFKDNTGDYGIGILSKYPIVNIEKTFINEGDMSVGIESRVLGYARVDVNGTDVNFFTTHFTIRNDADRVTEFAIVSEKTKAFKNVVLTGDFNTKSFAEFDQITHLAKVNTAETPYETFPEDHRFIDNIIYSSDFTLVENSVGMRVNDHSDHYMLYAKLKFTI